MTNQFSVSSFFDSRVINSSTNESRVMLSISIDNLVSFSVAIRHFRCTKLDYDRSYSNKSLSAIQKEVKEVISIAVDKAEDILNRLGNSASKDSFLRLYKSNQKLSNDAKTDAYSIFDDRIKELKAAGAGGNTGAFGSAAHVYNSRNSFKMFKASFYLEDVNEKWIESYKKFMLDNGRSISTVGMYLRTLRSIITQCIKDKLILIDKNPFEGVSVGWTVKSSKDIIYPDEMKKLWNYEPDGIEETRAKDFFFLCYLSYGINFRDISLLKNKNLKSDRFVFVRSKTSTTTSNEREITVYLCDEVNRIIDKYRTISTKPDSYLFSMFNCKDSKHHNATFIRYKRNANKRLTEISAKLKINRVYLGIARHSFATKLKLSGTPTIHISEYMGHSSEKTTANYLKQLPSEIHVKMNQSLLNF